MSIEKEIRPAPLLRLITIDKPAEHVEVPGDGGGPITIRWQTDDDDHNDVVQLSGNDVRQLGNQNPSSNA